jgi:hypothetical protein
VATPAGLVTAEFDLSSGAVSSHLIESPGAPGRIQPIPITGPVGSVVSITLVPGVARPVLVVTGSDGVTSVYELQTSVAGPNWTLTSTTSSDAFRAVDDVDTTFRGAVQAYPAGVLLAVSSHGVSDFSKNTGRFALGVQDMLQHSVCGAGAAYAVTANGIVLWGGQTCQPDGPAVTSSGVLVRLSRSPLG